MSALADLGWEAYPNEGVSTCSVQHTHTHIDIYDLAQNKMLCWLALFQGKR